jgi:hypothetical protein
VKRSCGALIPTRRSYAKKWVKSWQAEACREISHLAVQCILNSRN